MSTRTADLFFSLLAFIAFSIAAAGLLAAGACIVSASARTQIRATLATTWDRALGLGFAIALVATLGSLYYSEIADYIPCPLCWYQRIAMYPLTIILGVGWLRRDAGAAWYSLPIAVVGACVSSYHVLIERYPTLGDGLSCSLQAPCTVPYFRQFGWVTLAVMALAGFLAVATLSIAVLVGARATSTMAPS